MMEHAGGNERSDPVHRSRNRLFRLQLASTATLLLLAAWRLPPDLDETYYWTWSRDLAFAYYDHPPAIAWAIAMATGIFGSGLAGLRVVSLVSMAVVLIATISSVQRLVPAEHRLVARQLAILSLLGAPMFTLGYLPATPDPLQGAAAAIGAYLIVRGFRIRAAFLLTTALLIKHSTVFLLAGLILMPSAALGIVLASPLLVPWVMFDPSTGFQLSRLFQSETRGLVSIPMTLGSMMGTLGPFTALLLVALPFVRLSQKERSLALGSAVLLLACLVAVWFGSGEANWPMPAMVFALPALVGFVVRRGGRLLSIARTIATASAVLMMIALLHVLYPFVPLAPAKDRTLRSIGFDEVAAATRALALSHGASKVIARRYQIASELRYHLQDELTVHELGTSRRSQYDLWARPPLCAGEAAVVVMPHPDLPPELPADPIAPPRAVERARAGRVLDTYYVTPVRMRLDVGACE